LNRVGWDAVVIGGGVNGLTCAAYLARAGQRVLVLEAREPLGGLSELALTVGRLSPVVARELGLRRHGLRLYQPEVRVFAPQPDGRGITLWGDVSRTARELAENPLAGRGDDADAYVAADQRLGALAKALAPILRAAPADLTSPSLGRRVTSLARLARLDPQLVRTLPMSVRDLVEEWFQSDALRAVVATRGLLYTALGPRMPGTAAVLLTDAATSHAGIAGSAVFARGGPAAIAEALAAALREKGGEIRTTARVARVRRANDRAVGVTLDTGEQIDAPLVVSSLDPRTTLLELLEPEVLGPRLSWRASNIRQHGATAHIRFELGAMPAFPAAGGDGARLRGRIVIAPSMRYVDVATRPARYADTAAEPLLEMTMPSPTRLDVVAQAVAPDVDADSVADTVTRTIEPYAPRFTDLVESRTVVTPRDIEREYGARGGHPMHAEVALDQWFEWRPLHGHGRYAMPLDGFYLAGAGAHPGGGVTGLPGRLAAQRAIGDLKVR
jgi:phytoene dehydrogenase-like protein